MKSALQDTYFQKKNLLNCNGQLLNISQPIVMGILNVTPDSFYGESRYDNVEKALQQAKKMIAEGASILDIGAYSTRPHAENISIDEELKRLIPVIRAIHKNLPNAIISADTFRSSVAIAAVEAGASIINDISGGTLDEQMFDTIAKLQVPYVLMHIQGTPQTMQQSPHYEDIFKEVLNYFVEKTSLLKNKGVHDIIIDPGFGFGKALEHNYQLLQQLEKFRLLEYPLLVGISRKSMIYKLLDGTPNTALNGTTILNTIALQKGTQILRVHDVKEAVEAIKLVNQLNFCA